MTQDEIATFLAIVKIGSISRAADLLYVSQSTISHLLSSLEAELGVQLILRQKGFRTIELTKDGEDFVSIALEWDALWKKVNQFKQGNMVTTFNIGCHDSLNVFLFYQLHQQLKRLSSSSRIRTNYQILSHPTDRCYSMLQSGEMNVALIRNPIRNKSLEICPLFSEEFRVITPKESVYPNQPVNLSGLNVESEIFLSLSWNSDYLRWHEAVFGIRDIYGISINAASTIPRFMTDSAKWAVVPVSIANVLEKENGYQNLPFESDGPPAVTTFRVEPKYISSRIPVKKYFDEELSKFLDERPFLKRL